METRQGYRRKKVLKKLLFFGTKGNIEHTDI